MSREKILFIDACVRPDSRTHELAMSLLEKMTGDICEVNLYRENIKPLDMQALEERNRNLESGNLEHPAFRYARQFAEADAVVIAAPFWDLLFPAVVRNYIEAASVAGITFRYSEEGRPVGLCKAKRLYYVTTAGGFIGGNNFGYEYIKALVQGFYGIKEVRLFAAEGLDIVGADVEGIMEKAKAAIGEV